MLKDLISLRPEEKIHRDFYRKYRNEIFRSPVTMEQYRSFLATETNSGISSAALLQDDFVSVLDENEYFAADQDIAVFQHFRYMIPIWHVHTFFEMSYVLSGSFTNFYEGHEFQTSAGDILIIAPGSKHAVFTEDPKGVMLNILIRMSTFEEHFLNLIPNDDLLHTFFARALYHSPETPYLLFHTGDDPRLNRIIEEIYDEFVRFRRYKNSMLDSLLSIFFVLLLRRHDKDVSIPGAPGNLDNENTVFIIQYMQNHYNTITLSDLASFFNYSERQIERIIIGATGKNFRQNIRSIRMNHAARLLTKTDLPVQQIAEQTGYYDASHFRRAFREYYGTTPGDFRHI